ncbi:anaerobic C4-dicarboxylate transporter family protein, partial [Vibrio cincinnatiensis]
YLAELSNINHSITLLSILMVSVPATLFGTVLMSLYSMRRGKELEQDKDYQERLQDPIFKEKILNTTATSL